MRHWIITGSTQSYDIALSKNIWGIKENLKIFWDKSRVGDIIFFYVMSPISGIVGYGKITDKIHNNIPIWDEESKKGTVIFPLKFRFKTINVLPKEKWKPDCIKANNLKINYRKGMNPCMNNDSIDYIINLLDSFVN